MRNSFNTNFLESQHYLITIHVNENFQSSIDLKIILYVLMIQINKNPIQEGN